jgi:hypothetical protein
MTQDSRKTEELQQFEFIQTLISTVPLDKIGTTLFETYGDNIPDMVFDLLSEKQLDAYTFQIEQIRQHKYLSKWDNDPNMTSLLEKHSKNIDLVLVSVNKMPNEKSIQVVIPEKNDENVFTCTFEVKTPEITQRYFSYILALAFEFNGKMMILELSQEKFEFHHDGLIQELPKIKGYFLRFFSDGFQVIDENVVNKGDELYTALFDMFARSAFPTDEIANHAFDNDFFVLGNWAKFNQWENVFEKADINPKSLEILFNIRSLQGDKKVTICLIDSQKTMMFDFKMTHHGVFIHGSEERLLQLMSLGLTNQYQLSVNVRLYSYADYFNKQKQFLNNTPDNFYHATLYGIAVYHEQIKYLTKDESKQCYNQNFKSIESHDSTSQLLSFGDWNLSESLEVVNNTNKIKNNLN